MKIDQPILEMRNISKSFPGVRALDQVSFSLNKGEIHALLGENGSGKSTLMKILSGAYKKDEGEVIFKNKVLRDTSIEGIFEAGIAVVYQESFLAPNLTVLQNMVLGREERLRYFPFLLTYRNMREKCQEILETLEINIELHVKVKSLSIAQIQLLQIAKAISRNSEVIVLDEATASLTAEQVEKLFRTVKTLARKGVSIIFISHRLEEVLQIADRATVLRDGRYVGVRDVKNSSIDDFVEMMIGVKELKHNYALKEADRRIEVLTVRGLSSVGVVKNVSFSLFKGEVLGLAGLTGSGRTEILRGIFGCDPLDDGEVFIGGQRVEANSPSIAIKNGIGFLTENRKEEGLVLCLTVEDNIVLTVSPKISKYKVISPNKKNELVAHAIESLSIKTASQKSPVINLSGGNQQKVVIGKWVSNNCQVLLLDEPTKGVDVGAKVEIYNIVAAMANMGKSIIVVSSEINELMSICHRILVISKGSVVRSVQVSQTSREEVLRIMLHA